MSEQVDNIIRNLQYMDHKRGVDYNIEYALDAITECFNEDDVDHICIRAKQDKIPFITIVFCKCSSDLLAKKPNPCRDCKEGTHWIRLNLESHYNTRPDRINSLGYIAVPKKYTGEEVLSYAKSLKIIYCVSAIKQFPDETYIWPTLGEVKFTVLDNILDLELEEFMGAENSHDSLPPHLKNLDKAKYLMKTIKKQFIFETRDEDVENMCNVGMEAANFLEFLNREYKDTMVRSFRQYEYEKEREAKRQKCGATEFSEEQKSFMQRFIM